MDTSKMKNMVVLKNLPSNIVDEAIVILKPNQKLYEYKSFIKNETKKELKSNKKNKQQDSKEYIIQEAEMVIASYLSKMEEQKKLKSKNTKNIEDKYKRLRNLTIFLAGIIILRTIITII